MDSSLIYLRKNATGDLVEGTLNDGIAPVHLGQWERTWKPLMEGHQVSASPINVEEDANWNWRKKHLATRKLLASRWYTIDCENDLQGLMLLDLNSSCKLGTQFGKPLVYIDFIATAPWNRIIFEDPPRFSGVGRTFILQAIELSKAEDFKGRIGLHALPKAKRFYERCGMTSLGEDTAKNNLCYLEMTPEQAEGFLSNN